jgi:hypothetical protein
MVADEGRAMTYPIVDWVEQALLPQDVAATQAIRSALGGEPTTTLHSLLLSWAYHLGRVEAELDLDVDAPAAWVQYDLLAALLFRDWIEQDLLDLDPLIRDRVEQVVRHVDDWYASWTEVDVGVMAHVDNGDHPDHSRWWWNRIPPRGPIHEELVKHHGHVHVDPVPAEEATLPPAGQPVSGEPRGTPWFHKGEGTVTGRPGRDGFGPGRGPRPPGPAAGQRSL